MLIIYSIYYRSIRQGFEQNKFHMDRPAIELELHGDRPATILLSQGTPFEVIKFIRCLPNFVLIFMFYNDCLLSSLSPYNFQQAQFM
jgi:hypothetical protein